MSMPNQMSDSKEEKVKQRDFDLNVSAAIPGTEQMTDPKSDEIEMERVHGWQIENYSGNGVKAECKTERLADNGMEKSTNGDGMEAVNKTRKKTKVKLEFPHGGVSITRRVLRSSFASAKEDTERNDEHHDSVEGKIKGDIKGKFSGVIPCDGVETEVESSPKVEEVRVAGFTSELNVVINDNGSYDGYGNVVSHEKKQTFKRKRGRPRKLQISGQSDDGDSGLKCEHGVSTYLCNQQSDPDEFHLRLRGRTPKTQKTVEGPCISGKMTKRKRGRPPKLPNQNISDSVGESKRPKSNCEGKAKGPETDGGKHRRRKKILLKDERSPKPQKEKSSEETDNSDNEAKTRSKIHVSCSESQASNPSVDGETRKGVQESKHSKPVKRSISGAKKLLRDRILQLLLAAGWKVEYRPRNGKDYNDAVYVNPEGRTHWSVTLAYKVYRKHMESCTDDPKNATGGSNFALLSEEELHILERKVQKTRCDKGKEKVKLEDKDDAEDMVTVKRTGKRKLHARILPKERMRMQKKLSTSYRTGPLQKKLKGGHLSQNLVCMSLGLSKSVTKKKREEKHTRKRCAPLARGSFEDAGSKDDGFTLYEGKRTIMGWMIDLAIVPLKAKVHCMTSKTKVPLEGMITNEGILCDCCGEVFSIFDFEIHGGGKLNQPLGSLYLEGGASLLQCLLDSWNKQDKSRLKGFHFVDFSGGDPNDDTCGICGDGGDLICCDGCPSTFHQSCLGIKVFPSGSWFCFYCSCKFCGEIEATNDGGTARYPLLNCCLCEGKYHQACVRETCKAANDKCNHSFCGKNCQELFEGLQSLIGVKQELPEGFSWSFLRRFDLTTDVSNVEVSDKIVCNSKLAVAFSVMDECFSPLVDHRSGTNLLQNIVYNFGSNFSRLNFSSFLTAILERGDEIIAVASIRIRGNQLAEMPFIGTRYMYRHQGMCRRLMSGIESALGSLRVEKLVIPAVPELTETWTSGFGFKPVVESNKKKIKNLILMVFPGLDMLEKPLLTHNTTAEANAFSSNGNLPLVPEICRQVDAKANKPEGMCSPNLDPGFPVPGAGGNADNGNCGTADIESSLHLADSCSGLEKNEDFRGSNETESRPDSCNGCWEEKGSLGKVTDRALESHPVPAESCIGHRTDTQCVIGEESTYESIVVDDSSHQDKTDSVREKASDVEMGSPISDDCFEGKTEMTKEEAEPPDIKEPSRSVSDDASVEERKRKSNALASALQTQERSECHNESIPSQTETIERKVHLFECHII
ncbi:PREDICTED: uncharacterized protein LOC104805694 [Tarenaya hassleriana]|uniref:uncharacterized protein LOC104805694 n=1 Tax=Tarenaya hassleriana TaxID=28532 RepID=UPI00053C3B1D|nr:PREDICTED: uncharacterized protein LOC104805694 [Tarenaya hassleriana]XP_019057088.1 PREDICTED: uncharacterized protein LOC104805694 [Tarenaya hassleriana]